LYRAPTQAEEQDGGLTSWRGANRRFIPLNSRDGVEMAFPGREENVMRTRVNAIITLPGGVSGELEWNGKTVSLHERKQELQLPVQ
jgi:hypothetical protein